MKYIYPAVFKTEDTGKMSVRFPDIEGCYLQAKTFIFQII